MQLHPPTTVHETPAPSSSGANGPASPLRRRLLWIFGSLAVLLLLIFTPPLINANRYQRQIARSMSGSLGRPVHLDNVALRLLPLPGLTLTNLVVSEEPAFGDEPTIRANTVEATLRLSSLWRGQVEFSTVRFIEPSVNLVRNAEGRWNFADVLLHASHVDTAPTVQRRAGPTPRFPYIEATGGRVNVKLGEDKLPFSLTDADFALWLPSANQWRVRLRGQPARTDTNITDPGTLRVEGDLERGGAFADVPVNLQASWHDAPLGQASRLLTGEDSDWRGTLNLDATLSGTLGDGQLSSQLTLGGLRRAAFAAAHPLDLQINCAAALATESVTLNQLRCTMPDSAPAPMLIQSATLNLQHPELAPANVAAEGIPLHWGMLWAALFSARVPTDLHPSGTIALHLLRAPGVAPGVVLAASMPVRRASGHGRARARTRTRGNPLPAVSPWRAWTGEVVVKLPPMPVTASAGAQGASGASPTAVLTSASPKPASAATPVVLTWVLDGGAAAAGAQSAGALPVLRLQPLSIHLGPSADVTVNAVLSGTGYQLAVAGSASPAALLVAARYLPQLGDGLGKVLSFPPTGLLPSKVDFTCEHPWGAAQTCTSLRPTPPASRALLYTAPVNVPPPPALLRPHSLSPLDQNPRLGGLPPAGSPQL